jgi:hypothetical protein
MDLCALVLDTCDLLERARRTRLGDALLVQEAICLREELCAGLSECCDDAAAADGLGALSDLDDLLVRLGALPQGHLALSA